MNLMNLDLDGVLTVEKLKVPFDKIAHLSHDLFKPLPLTVSYNGKELTRGRDYIPYAPDERLYYQKNVTLFTAIKILNDELVDKELQVEYFACGDYIKAEIWNEYPTAEALKLSLQSKTDNADFVKEVRRINGELAAEAEARTVADNTLQENINAEKDVRTAVDEELQANIDAEAQERINSDNTLQANIDAETDLRVAENAELRQELEHEADTRSTADATLQANIDAEAEARTAQDDILSENIRQEEDTRAAADSALQEAINTEEVARTEKDNVLTDKILQLEHKIDSFTPGERFIFTNELPTENIIPGVLYFVKNKDGGTANNRYTEYVWDNEAQEFEVLGTSELAVIIDSMLSSTSENPVQNKVIYAELQKKAGTAVATQTANGLMNKNDKTKLDGIAAGANKTTVENVLTSTSTTNALSAAQGKVLNNKFNNYLPLAGGVLKGNVKCHTTQDNSLIRFESEDSYGAIAIFGADGTTILSGGESGVNLLHADKIRTESEEAVVSADTKVVFYSNCQNVANAKEAAFETDGNFAAPAFGKIKLIGDISELGLSGIQTVENILVTMRKLMDTENDAFAYQAILPNRNGSITNMPTTWGTLHVLLTANDGFLIRYDGVLGRKFNGSYVGCITDGGSTDTADVTVAWGLMPNYGPNGQIYSPFIDSVRVCRDNASIFFFEIQILYREDQAFRFVFVQSHKVQEFIISYKNNDGAGNTDVLFFSRWHGDVSIAIKYYVIAGSNNSRAIRGYISLSGTAYGRKKLEAFTSDDSRITQFIGTTSISPVANRTATSY